MYKVKIVLVGPCQAGKTMIANFLADAMETVGGEYRPTAGVRILEFELSSVNVNNKNIKVDTRYHFWSIVDLFNFPTAGGG